METMKSQVASPPEAVLWGMISGCLRTQALRVVAKLGIPDLLHDGPQSAEALAVATGAHAPSLRRLLRTLSTVGLFIEDEMGRFATTPTAEMLRTDHPQSIRDFAILMGEPMVWQAWGAVETAILTGQPAFNHVFGESFFAYCEKRPEESHLFNGAMTSVNREDLPAILAAYDFSASTRIVDVGGGEGMFLRGILEQNQNASGVLFDLPTVVNDAEAFRRSAVADRCEIVGGDMFQSVPSGGDTYLMKMIIHDWNDDEAIQILRNCRRAMAADGKVLVFEAVLRPPNEPDPAKWSDLNMLVLVTGRERTEDEFRGLYAAAGLHLTRVIATDGPSILEGIPV